MASMITREIIEIVASMQASSPPDFADAQGMKRVRAVASYWPRRWQ